MQAGRKNERTIEFVHTRFEVKQYLVKARGGCLQTEAPGR